MPFNVPVYRGLDEKDRQRLMRDVTVAYGRAAAELPATPEPEAEEETVGPTSAEPIEIPEFSDLIGVDPSVYRQINAALKAGKQHLMFYGPPGTGKTTLAQLVAGTLHDAYTMITGSADWTSQDVIGGYQPVGEGRVRFVPGVLLQNFDRPLIIDELNRCDIDKVIGPLFTILSEQKTTLPYRTEIGDEKSAAYVILPKPKPGSAAHEFAPKPGWRIIATINSIDKAALYQMSFALTRRFGWIYVDVPSDLQGFLLEVMRKWDVIDAEDEPAGDIPLTRVWRAVNGARVIGPAPLLDMLKTIRAIDADIDLLKSPAGDQASAYLDGFYMYVLPMLRAANARRHSSQRRDRHRHSRLRCPGIARGQARGPGALQAPARFGGMSEDLDSRINGYLTRFLLRYFRNAVAVRVERPDLDTDQDLDLLRLHWAISEPVRNLIAHLAENRHQIQAVLDSRLQEDDARVRGRFDARATVIRRVVTGHPTLMVSHEPLRTYNSGPNHVLTWVLEQAWRLVLRFQDMLPQGASYLEAVGACAPGLETIRRFDAIHQAAKQLNLARRPGPQAVKEASRSRRPIYVLACEAYRALQAIEAGEEESITRLLNDTLLGPLHIWQRFELAVGLGMARALSAALARPIRLGFFVGGREPIARVGEYEVHWQSRTDAYLAPVPEPSEAVVARLLEQYGLAAGFDRPDLLVLDRATDEAVALVEVKFWTSAESDGTDALQAAVDQLVRYARGYRPIENIDGLLDYSIAALVRHDTRWTPNPKPHGLPLIVDFEGIALGRLDLWARRLVFRTEIATAS